MGATKKRGEKKLTVEEFLPIFGQVSDRRWCNWRGRRVTLLVVVSQVRVQKDQGSYEDFMECLKLYDKQENGTMLLAELEHSLKALG